MNHITLENFKTAYTYTRYTLGTIIALGFVALPFYLIFFLGFVKGFHTALLIWSFFVLCLPFGFASSIISLPFWLSLGRGFTYAELTSWICAIALNFYTYNHVVDRYFRYASTHLLYNIINNPWPYWCIIAANAWAMLFRTFFHKTQTWPQFFMYYALNICFMAAGFAILLHLTYHEWVIILNIQS